jgi:cell wall-associated NlpC family hydrolase
MVSEVLYGEILEITACEGPWLLVYSKSQSYAGWMEWTEPVNSPTSENVCIAKMPFLLVKDGIEIPLSIGSLVNEQEISGLDAKERKHLLQPIIPETAYDLSQIVDAANWLKGTPYLWGGRSRHGIDCSGLVQVCCSTLGLMLPRDAHQQATCGSTIGYEDMEKGDLAFFSSPQGKIVHVGICAGNGLIIHASGFVRQDQLLETGILRLTTHEMSHQLAFIKRLDRP